VSEHAGAEFLALAIGPREAERLAYMEEAKRDPASVWYEPQAARQSRAGRRRSRDKA
jgi:hypothetical protein